MLIKTLLNIGVGHRAVNWFHSYLSERMQIVRHGNVTSDPVVLKKGVPQGSVLGPLLFIIYINNVCSEFNYSQYHLYANDTIMYSCASTPETACANLQSDFASLQLGMCRYQIFMLRLID